jgi:hypothetical protein
MPNSTDITSPETAAGRAAGEVFARERADMMDRGLLREAREANAATGTLLVRLFAAYADDDLSHDETAELLFGDATARPSDAYVAGFLEGAIAALEAAFGGPDEDDKDDEPSGREDTVWGSLGEALVAALDGCVQNGMSYPMIIMVVGGNGSVVAARYAAPGEEPVFLAEHMEGAGVDFPIDGLVTDEHGGAVHVRVTPEGMTAQLLVPSERPPLQS